VNGRRIGIWIAVTMACCAALGGWAGHNLGDGGPGMVVLIAAVCAVLGSFAPGWITRLVRRKPRGSD
jgi:hypothetical protein